MNKKIKKQNKIRTNPLPNLFREGLGKALTIIILLIAISAKSQFYTQLNFGYNAPIYKKTNEFVNITKYKSTSKRVKTETTERAKINVVQGINIGLSGGYIYKNKYQFQLGVNYLNNNKFAQNNNTVVFDSLYINDVYNTYSYSFIQETKTRTYSSKIITINPSFTYLKQYKKFTAGVKIGLSAQYVTIYEQYNKNYNLIDSSRYAHPQIELQYRSKIDSLYKYEYPSQLYFNLYAGVSLAYNFTKNINAFINVNLPLTNYVYNTNSDKKTQYYSKFCSDEYSLYNEDEYKGEIIKEDNNKYEIENINNYKFYSRTINFSIGIRYTFGKKLESETLN